MSEKTSFRDSALRAVAIIGLIAILVLGAWGIIQLVVGLPDFFSNFGNSSSITSTKSSETIVINTPSIVTSQQPFALSWAHSAGSSNYSFAISYSCASDLSFAAPTPAGQYQQVPCNTPFNYTNASGSMQLVAVLPSTDTQQVNTTITVSATRLSDNKVTATATSTITVLPVKNAKTSTSKPATTTAKPTSTYTASGRTSNLYGSADLAVQILSAQPVSGRYQVVFQVSNVGTNVTPYGWEFTAQLPTNPTYTYQSQPQQKLYPGDKIVYTLGFTMSQSYTSASNYTTYPYNNSYNNNCGVTQNYTYNGYANYPTTPTVNCNSAYNYSYPNYYNNQSSYYGNNTFSVTVDPQSLVQESNKTNNTASATLSY